MAAIKTVIFIKQYSIPVSMTKATIDTDIQLHEYHIKDRYRTCRKTLCSGCGEELAAEDIVKGFEYEHNCLVLLKKDELRQIKTDTDNSINILYSTSLNQISPVYFKSSYFAAPESGSEKIFEIFRYSLLEEQKIVIGNAVLGGQDSHVAIIPTEDGLLISKLNLDNEINTTKSSYKKTPISQSELESVKSLLNDIYFSFDLSDCENEYQNKLRDLITSKINELIDTYTY